MIKDSGERREFSSGAVRDMADKGRCDLLPLHTCALWLDSRLLSALAAYQSSGDPSRLLYALNRCIHEGIFPDESTLLLEVAHQMQEGAEKYGERNWEKGIPTASYVDSAVRHYLKHRRGDTDERHDRALAWNLLCALWTAINKPELNSYNTSAEDPQ